MDILRVNSVSLPTPAEVADQSPPDTPHPLTALKAVDPLLCVVCARPTVFTCSYCKNGPTYCSPAHHAMVSDLTCLYQSVSDMLASQDWPKHRPICQGSDGNLTLEVARSVMEEQRIARTVVGHSAVRIPTLMRSGLATTSCSQNLGGTTLMSGAYKGSWIMALYADPAAGKTDCMLPERKCTAC